MMLRQHAALTHFQDAEDFVLYTPRKNSCGSSNISAPESFEQLLKAFRIVAHGLGCKDDLDALLALVIS